MATAEEKSVMIELRTKLELRTLFLRFSIALNSALLGGLLIFILNQVYGK